MGMEDSEKICSTYNNPKLEEGLTTIAQLKQGILPAKRSSLYYGRLVVRMNIKGSMVEQSYRRQSIECNIKLLKLKQKDPRNM